MRPSLLALLLITGCQVHTVDPCAGETHTCIAVQLQPTGSVHSLDSVVMRVTAGSIDATKTNGLGGRSFTLPAAVALVLPTLTSKTTVPVTIDVVGSLAGKTVAGGIGHTTISSGQHVTVTIVLEPGMITLPPPPDMAVSDGSPGGDMANPCPAGFHVCNGGCVDSNSVMTCGAACSPCPTDPNAVSIGCDGTACVAQCQPGYHACGGVCASNGDPASCNQSCSPCTVPAGGTATCDGTMCGGSCPANEKLCLGSCIAQAMSCVGSCPSGTHDCSGLCDDDTNVNSCGALCTPCPVPTNADHATCSAGMCGVVCSMNYKQCGTACIPTAECCTMNDCVQPTNGSATCDTTKHSCVVSCDNTYTNCNESCVNTSTDTSNCGVCTNACSATETCSASACHCGSNAGCAGNVTCSGGSCTCNATSLSCTTGGACCLAVKGFDVNKYNGTVNWTTVATDGLQFALTWVTDGATVDPQFTNNWAGIKSAGLARGGILFFEPATDAATQANAFVNALSGAGLLPSDFLMIDFETNNGQTSAALLAELQTVLQTVQTKTGHLPTLYVGAGFWNGLNPGTTFSSYPLFNAQWTTSCPTIPNDWTGWTFWQNSSTGTVNGAGTSGQIDTDYFNGTPADLQKFLTNQSSGTGFSATLCGHD